MMRRIIAFIMALALTIAVTSAQADTKNPVAGKKVAYINRMPTSNLFQMSVEGSAALCKALGVQFDCYFCDGDFNMWQDRVSTCASAGYDGLFLVHGNQDGSYTFLKSVLEQYPDLKIITFDTDFYTDGEYKKLPGVTQIYQADHDMLKALLDALIEKFGEGVRLVKVWRGPNYDSAFERRDSAWKEYEAAGKIKTVGEIQPLADSVDSADSVAAAYLQGLDRNSVDGIVSYYDIYGQGVYNAIQENPDYNGGGGPALPLCSVDIDQVDITNMQTRPDIWYAAGTTDWNMNGELCMRLLLLEIAGEYDKILDPVSGKYGVDLVEIPGGAILSSAIDGSFTVHDLGKIGGKAFGNSGNMSVADWMPVDLLKKGESSK